MKQTTTHMYARAKSVIAHWVIACLVVTMAPWSLPIVPTATAASSFRPTIYVNTEAFLAIDDDDTTADVVLRFGDSLAKTLTFNRLLDRFQFNDDVYTTGTFSASGTIVTESGAYIDGTSLVVQAGSNNVGIGTAAPQADLHVVGSETRLDTGTTDGTTSLTFIDNNDEKAHLLLNQATFTFDIQSDGRISIGSSDYVTVAGTNYTNIQGSTTFIGNNVGIGTTGPKTKLDVAGAISGSFVYATQSFSGAGLTDCDGGTSKLLWDATTGRFSCGTVTSNTYTAGQGLSLNGANAFSLNTTITGSLVEFQTVSGTTVYASNSLRSSGSLVWKGTASGGTINAAGGKVTIGPGGITTNSTAIGLGAGYYTNVSANAIQTRDGVDQTGAPMYLNAAGGYVGIARSTSLVPKAQLDVVGTISGSLLTQNGAGNNYLLGNVGIGLTTPKTKLEVSGAVSGSFIYATRSFSGAGLSDCDTAGTSKLLWDATTGRFSCGTDTDTNTTYTAGQGLALNGTAFSLGQTISGTLLEFQTVSGSTVYGSKSLRSSGSLVVEGDSTIGDASTDTLVVNANIGSSLIPTLNVTYDIGAANNSWATGYFNTVNAVSLVHSNDAITAGGNVSVGGALLLNPSNNDAYVEVRFGANDRPRSLVYNNSIDEFTIDDTLIASGSLLATGALSGARLYGLGLSDCDTAGTSKLLWDATTGRFSCGTDSGTTYTAGQGLSLNGANAFSLNTTITGSLVEFQTVSGTLVRANTTLASSGGLVVEGGALLNASGGNNDVRMNNSVGGALFATDADQNKIQIGDGGGPDYLLDVYSSSDDWLLKVGPSAATAADQTLIGFGKIGSFQQGSPSTLRLNPDGGTVSVGAALTVAGNVTADTDTFILNSLTNRVGIGASTPKAKLDVVGAISGSFIYATRSFSGAGLSDCDTAGTSKLLWDATTGRFSCGTDQTGSAGGNWSNTGSLQLYFDNRYVNTSGDTMTGDLVLSLADLKVLRGSGIIVGNEPNHTVFTVQGTGSQAASLQEWRDGDGNTLASVDPAGVFNTYGGIFSAADITTDGGLTVNNYSGPGDDATISFGNDDAWQYLSFRDASQQFEFSTRLEVQGILSGVTLYATKSFSGAGLSDCDTAGTSKLLWDATTGRFSCGTDTDTNTTYTAGQGLTLAGTSFKLNAALTGSSLRFDTISGSTVHSERELTSSGTIIVENIDGSTRELIIADSVSSEASQVFMNATTGHDKDNDGLYLGNYHNIAFLSNRESSSLYLGTTGLGRIGITAGGNVGIGVDGTISEPIITQASAETKLEVGGAISGSFIYATRSFSGAGLSDCDTAGTSKLLWDATTGRFSCGTDTDTDTNTTYTAGQGLTLTSTSFSLSQTISGTLLEFQTVSGSTVYGSKSVRSSGALVWEGAGSGQALALGGGSLFVSATGSTVINENSKPIDFRIEGDTDANLFFTDGSTDRVGIGTVTPKNKLEVRGAVSGSFIYASTSFSGAGLSDCDTAGTSKLLWDATTGRFSCGTDSGTTYTAGQGLTLNGSSFRLNSTVTGAVIQALNSLASSGALSWKGAGTGQALAIGGGSVTVSSSGASFFNTGLKNMDFGVFGRTNNSLLYVDASGSGTTATASGGIGIGTRTPVTQLHVAGRLPTIQQSLASLGTAPMDVEIQGKTAYVVDQSNNLKILDVSNASSPVVKSTLATGLTTLVDVAVQGSYAYVPGALTFKIVDVSNPASPFVVSTGPSVAGAASYVAVSGPYLYMTDAAGVLSTFDISNPQAAVLTSTVSSVGGKLTIDGNYLYMVEAGTIRIFNLRNPAQPFQQGTVSVTNASHLAVQGRYAYVARYGSSAVSVVDVSDPANPVAVGSVSVGNTPQHIAVSGRYAYVADFLDSKLHVLDISSPVAPRLLGGVATGGATPMTITVSGRYAYITNRDSSNVSIFDLGGAYIQQLEAGSAEVGALTVRTDFDAADASIRGGLSAGRLYVFGNMAASGALKIAQGFSAGSGNIVFSRSGSVVFNEQSRPVDFRIEGDTDANAFVVDASTDRIGIGTAAPKNKLEVAGAVSGAFVYASTSFSGAGLSDCDNATTSKLLWDATTGRFSCGTDQSGGSSGGSWSNTGSLQTYFDNRYVNTAGDTMTGDLILNLANLKVLRGSGIIIGNDPGQTVFVVQGTGSHSANLQEWRNSDETPVAYVDWYGSVFGGDGYFRDNLDLNTDDGDNDTFITFGNDNGDQTLTYKNTAQQFEFSTNTNISGDFFANDGNFRAGLSADNDLTINADNENSVSTITFGNDDFPQTLSLADDGSLFSLSAGLYANGAGSFNGQVFGYSLSLGENLTDEVVPIQFNSDTEGHIFQYDGVDDRFELEDPLYLSGSLLATSAVSGASLRGMGLTDCDNGTTSKLLWDATTGRFSCGTDQTGSASYTAGQGLSLNGANAFSLNTTITGSLVEFQTVSGALVYAARQLSTSGSTTLGEDSTDTLMVWGAATFDADSTFNKNVTIGDSDTRSLNVASNVTINTTNGANGFFNIRGDTDTNLFYSNASTDRIGIGTNAPDTKLDVVGAISGSFIYATRSFSGAGLTDCDGGTSKLLWDATTGRFSCGTVSATAYTAGQGLSLNGANAFSVNSTLTGTLLKFTTLTGSLVSVQTLSGRTLNVSGTGSSPLLSTTLGKPTVRIGGSGSLVIEARSSDPGSAPTNSASLFVQKVGGRPMVHQGSGSTFSATQLQTSLFSNQIMMLTAGGGTTINGEGTTVTNDTTVSHPAASETFGYMANFATAATNGDEAGTSSANTAFFRGSTAGANGFFYYARVGVVDTTSITVFSGMADQTIATMVGADNPTGNHVGFQFSTGRGDTNWMFTTKDNTTQNVNSTGIAFTANKVYDLMFTCTKQCASITWEIRNVTDGTSAMGTTSSNLPTTSTALRIVLGVEAETTTAKNIRMSSIYVESDR